MKMDNVISKQIELEKLLSTTDSPDKEIYQLQLKLWIKAYTSGAMPQDTVLMVINNRIRELQPKASPPQSE